MASSRMALAELFAGAGASSLAIPPGAGNEPRVGGFFWYTSTRMRVPSVDHMLRK